MAVAVGERTLGCSTNVGKNKRGRGLARDTFEIYAVPGRDGGGEDARFWA